MRKIILNLAMSLDGYIADTAGGFDWIEGDGDKHNDTENTFDYEAFTKGIDTVVMGSKAYEDCVLTGLNTFEDKKILVATRRILEGRDNVEFIQGDICNKILSVKAKEGLDIWLFGGAGLTDPFIKANIVDTYIVGIIPVILGNGRSLFKGDYPKIDLHLDEISISDGIMIPIYSKKNTN